MSRMGMFFFTIQALWCGFSLAIWQETGFTEWLFSAIAAVVFAVLIFIRERRA